MNIPSHKLKINHKHNKYCGCNIHTEREIFKKNEDYEKEYNRKYKPQGYLQEYEEYDFFYYT